LILDVAVVRGVFGDAVRFAAEGRTRGDDAHFVRLDALNFGEQLGIKRKLEDRRSFGFTRQLAVVRLVRITAECR